MLTSPRNKQAIDAIYDAPYAVEQALIPETYLPFPPVLRATNTLRLSDYLFQIFSVHLDCGMLINQFDCQHEPHAVALSYKSPMKALHHAALNTNFFADNKVTIRFDPLPAEARAQKFDLGIRNISTPALPKNPQHPGRRETPGPPGEINRHKQVGGKQGRGELHPLPVLPDPDGFIDREK